MSRLTALPMILPGATEFSAEPELADELWAVRKLTTQPQWRDRLIQGTDQGSGFGRPREAGNWALAFLAFTASRHADMEPWWASSSRETWTACGFSAKPPYSRVWARFVELEQEDPSNAFAEVVGLLVQHARRHEPNVGMDLHVDATEAETNARLVHDCQDGENCSRGQRRRGSALYPRRASAGDARATRHENAEKPTDEIADLDIGDADESAYDEIRKVARFHIGGCWYRSLDTDAGVRAYRGRNGKIRRFWHGYYTHKATDHYTGAPVAIHVASSSVQEHLSYPALMNKALAAMGATPRAAVGDRGLSVASVFEWNTRRGIASVLPYRKRSRVERRNTDTDLYDRHGVVRCKHCGGPTRRQGFAADPSPRLWVKCSSPTTPECQRPQSLACSHDWRTLIPLWRTDEAYFALRETHQQYERVHHMWRARYRVGADNHATRPKRIGAAWQQLRANAALVIEWLRILDREGWLGSARRNTSEPRTHTAREILARFLNSRRAAGLHLPYGPRAEALGLTGQSPDTELPGSGPPGPADELPF